MAGEAVKDCTRHLWCPCWCPAQDSLHGVPHTSIPAEGFRRIPALAPGRPKANQEVFSRADKQTQTKASCWLQPAPQPDEEAASAPVYISAPVEKRRPIRGDNPGLATASASGKRRFGTSSSRPDKGPQLSSGPQKCRWSGAATETTTVASKRMAPGVSWRASRKPLLPKACGRPVSMAIRQRYFNLFLEECLQLSSAQEAVHTAWTQEQVAYESSPSENSYLLTALNVLRKLRGLVPSAVPGLSRAALYSRLQDYVLSEAQLQVHGYPFPHPLKPGAALLFTVGDKPKKGLRTCCRCGSEFAVSSCGCCVSQELCHYHWGRLHHTLGAGGWESRYTCCFAVWGSRGCQVARQHVRDGRKENLAGFVRTLEKPFAEDAHPGIYALDCEMSYTTHGLELTRVTVVDAEMRVTYDTFVKPDNPIVDYNTMFSGVTEDHLAFTSTRLPDVQAVLLSLFSADTILIGHSLESDLLALKLIHKRVVDTAVLFPHRRGLPFKRSLRNLTACYLSQIIQGSSNGHNSQEDARACMSLVLWKMQEDAKTPGLLPAT